MHAGAAEVVPAVRVVQRIVAVHRLAAERQVLRADVDAVEHEVPLSLRQRLLLASVRSPRLRPLCTYVDNNYYARVMSLSLLNTLQLYVRGE